MNQILTVLYYVLIMVIVLGALIFIHELGHFITARLCSVSIKEFAIGMGPKIFSKNSKKSNIKYTLRALPIGGFVSMEGEDDDSIDANAFCNKKIWQRMLIVLAGPAMNLILGLVLMSVIVCSQANLYSTQIDYFGKDAVSNQSLREGDIIIKVDNVRVHTWDDLVYEITYQGYEPIDMVIERDGQRITLEDVPFATIESSGSVFGRYDFAPKPETKNFSNIIKHTVFRSISSVKNVYDSLGGLFSGRFGLEAVSGPVGITEIVGNAARDGILSFLNILVLLTINLGTMNLLPFPALDGGRFLFLIIEAIRRKPLDRNVEGYVNFIGIIILFAFMIMVAFKDIFSLFS